MKWLARLDVEAKTIQEAGVSSDIYSWHKGLWACFPNQPDAERDFLTRIDVSEGAFRFWILAEREPMRPDWCPPDGFALKEISPSFLMHRYYAFDLRANPVKSVAPRGIDGEPLYRPDGKRMRSKRVPLVKPDDLHQWLIKKGKVRCRDQDTGLDVPGGFQIMEKRPLEISPMQESYFRKKDKKNGKKHTAYHGGVQFRGVLEVTDREAFKQTWQSGIGSAKGFGFGLLLLAPTNL